MTLRIKSRDDGAFVPVRGSLAWHRAAQMNADGAAESEIMKKAV